MLKRTINTITVVSVLVVMGPLTLTLAEISADQAHLLELVTASYKANMLAIRSFEADYRMEILIPQKPIAELDKVTPDNSKRILKEGSIGFMGERLYNSERINGGKITSFVRNGMKMKFRFPERSNSNYVAQSCRPGRLQQLTPLPWEAANGGFTEELLAGKMNIISVEELLNKKGRQIKITASKTFTDPEGNELELQIQAYYSQQYGFMFSHGESYISNKLVSKSEITGYKKLSVEGNVIYIPVGFKGFVKYIDGNIRTVQSYRLDCNSIRINQPIPDSKFEIKLGKDDVLYDVDLDTTVVAPYETKAFSDELALDELGKGSFNNPARPKTADILEVPLCKGITIKLKYIPPGRFIMGSPKTEKGYGTWHQKILGCSRPKNEGPMHEVRIDKGFYIGQFEITNAQYRCFKPGYHQPKISGLIVDNDNQPAAVSWLEAKAFCQWLSKKSGLIVRLPTEREWEYACRANTTSRFFWGEDARDAAQYANVFDRRALANWPDRAKMWEDNVFDCNDGFVVTAPVGSFKPNNFDLYDMIGNRAEWCEEAYYEYGHEDQRENRQDNNNMRIVRGGSYESFIYQARSASRGAAKEGTKLTYGFRIVVEPR